MATIELIVGLGNPGKQYADTRHNAGFWFVDFLAAHLLTKLRLETKFSAECGQGLVQGKRVFLVKPLTYMNRSGISIAAIARFYHIDPETIWVAHDDLDLAPGHSKIKQGGGHAGHNGLKDLQLRLGSADFWRLRLGIGHPRDLRPEQSPADFVLDRPTSHQRQAIETQITDALTPLLAAIKGE